MDADEIRPIALQMVDALEAAHEQGIVHRDLKPANIKIRPDGAVKILDFGLAKAVTQDDSSNDVANSPTLTAQSTQLGMILGTAAYMAPEQARGRRVDRRADIWAFGCVLFEMLTGRRPFGGDDVSEMLASVLKDAPAWNQLPTDTPEGWRRLLRRCLEKDPKRRLSAIGDARWDLEPVEPSISVVPHAATAGATVRPPVSMWAAGLLLAAGAIVGAGIVAMVRRSPAAPVVAETRLSILAPDGR